MKTIRWTVIIVLALFAALNLAPQARADCPELDITSPATLPSGTEGQSYSYQIQTSGGQPPISFIVLPSYPLPSGLNLSSSGLISGSTSDGSYSFKIRAIDSCSPVNQISQKTFSLTINEDSGSGGSKYKVQEYKLKVKQKPQLKKKQYVKLNIIKQVNASPGSNSVNFSIKTSQEASLKLRLHKAPVPKGRECDETLAVYRATFALGWRTQWNAQLTNLDRNRTYTWEVCAKDKDGDVHRAKGTVKTLKGKIRVMFNKIIVTDDSDDTSAGDLTFYFYVHNLPYKLRNATVDTGGDFNPSVHFDLDGALTSVNIKVHGQDDDCTGSIFDSSDCGYADHGVVQKALNLKEAKPFSYNASHHGLGFTVKGEIMFFE